MTHSSIRKVRRWLVELFSSLFNLCIDRTCIDTEVSLASLLQVETILHKASLGVCHTALEFLHRSRCVVLCILLATMQNIVRYIVGIV